MALNYLLLYLMFWIIAGAVFAHIFLFSIILIIMLPMLIFPEQEKNDPSITQGLNFWSLISVGALILLLLFFTFFEISRQPIISDVIPDIGASDVSEMIWIFTILLVLFFIQFYNLIKRITEIDE